VAIPACRGVPRFAQTVGLVVTGTALVLAWGGVVSTSGALTVGESEPRIVETDNR
jgi:hypothetical protein